MDFGPDALQVILRVLGLKSQMESSYEMKELSKKTQHLSPAEGGKGRQSKGIFHNPGMPEIFDKKSYCYQWLLTYCISKALVYYCHR